MGATTYSTTGPIPRRRSPVSFDYANMHSLADWLKARGYPPSMTRPSTNYGCMGCGSAPMLLATLAEEQGGDYAHT